MGFQAQTLANDVASQNNQNARGQTYIARSRKHQNSGDTCDQLIQAIYQCHATQTSRGRYLHGLFRCKRSQMMSRSSTDVSNFRDIFFI